jgi:hypothetical protein
MVGINTLALCVGVKIYANINVLEIVAQNVEGSICVNTEDKNQNALNVMARVYANINATKCDAEIVMALGYVYTINLNNYV